MSKLTLEEKTELVYNAVVALTSIHGWRSTGLLSKYMGLLNSSSPLDDKGHTKAVQVISGEEERMLNAIGHKTAFTTGLKIVFTAKFLMRLTPEGIMFLLCHELGHPAFKHNERENGRNPSNWNIATDIEINSNLSLKSLCYLYSRTEGFKAADLFESESDYCGMGYSPATEQFLTQYENQMAEEIYYDLSKRNYTLLNSPKKKKGKSPSSGGSGKGQQGPNGDPSGSESDSNSNENGQPDPNQKPGKGKPDPNSKGKGDSQPNPNGGNQQGDQQEAGGKELDKNQMDDHHIDEGDLREELKKAFGEKGEELADKMGLANENGAESKNDRSSIIDDIIRKAHQQSQQQSTMDPMAKDGKLPGQHIDSAYSRGVAAADVQSKYKFSIYTEALIEEALLGRWNYSKLREDDFSIMSRDPVFREKANIARQVWSPDLVRNSQQARMLCIIDTSGSVSDQEMAYFTGIIRYWMTEYNLKVRIVSADTVARGVCEYDSVDEFPDIVPLKGGGGTDMLTPMAQELSREYDDNEEPQMVVLLSDGEFHMYSKEQLLEEMKKYNQYASMDMIPPIAAMITNEHYCNFEHNELGKSFGGGGFRCFYINPAERANFTQEYTVTKEEGITLG